MKGILFLNSGVPPAKILQQIKKKHKTEGVKIIAADGGYVPAYENGFQPDIVIGDLDSIKGQNLQFPDNCEVIYRPSQYMNDLEKALVYCKQKNFKELVIVGVTGRRTDHTLANISILFRYMHIFSFFLYGEEAQLFLLDKQKSNLKIKAKVGQQISLIPLSHAQEINTKGLKYPLNKSSLHFGIREGSSNEVSDSNVSISIKSGKLLILLNYSL